MRAPWTLLVLTGLLAAAPTSARAVSASFRRPEVIKLAKMNDWTHLATALQTKEGLVVGACEKGFEGGRTTAKLRWVFVPLDRSQPVRLLTSKEVRGFGLRTVTEARKLAARLGPAARFDAGKPYRDATFAGITTHHAKPRNSGLSYRFTAEPGQPLDGGLHPHDPGTRVTVKRVGFSVPVLRGQKRGESAWPDQVEFVPLP